ncbi:hypothetical protein PPYR_09461 [Photinus pyralis]|uniref:(S)-2-hydroxy-acid oxidase n=1 Tax=Photinus pyralis TaxID=7054 RepID=A0A1Y1L1W2_PHOPY|nr:hydroxyacid oxidase 1 [Photinus pyralis]KAB0798468.1 hypothetical protein PPYR_09461 [Photinus pyralis]
MHTPVCVQDFETHAFQVLAKGPLDYYKSGAGDQLTLENNRKAFSKLRIRPRCFRDVSTRNLSTTVMGTTVCVPFGIAPTAMQKLAHPDGEIASVRAAEKMGTIFILSTISTTSLEDVAAAAPNAHKWYQLYIYKDREITANLVKRAEAAGFKAIVLTVDSPRFGIRRDDIRNNFKIPPHLTLANFVGDKATNVSRAQSGSGIANYVISLFDPALVWEDIAWLRQLTTLPIVVKGILTAEDAQKAVKMGVSGIMVSNHGGRQVDGVPASIEALPEVVKAVGDQVEVYMDGGIRQGVDVFKALALGAKMVFVGRPNLWGLAYNGEEGATKVLDTLKFELDNVMSLSGCTSIKEVTSDLVVHKSYYSRL